MGTIISFLLCWSVTFIMYWISGLLSSASSCIPCIPLLHKPTRGTRILDLVLTNVEHCVRDVEVGETLGNSDHHIVRFDITITKDRILNKTLHQNQDQDQLLAPKLQAQQQPTT